MASKRKESQQTLFSSDSIKKPCSKCKRAFVLHVNDELTVFRASFCRVLSCSYCFPQKYISAARMKLYLVHKIGLSFRIPRQLANIWLNTARTAAPWSEYIITNVWPNTELGIGLGLGIKLGLDLRLGLGLRLRVTVRNSVRIRSRVRGKGWGNYGAIVSYSFCMVRSLLCHLIFFKNFDNGFQTWIWWRCYILHV